MSQNLRVAQEDTRVDLVTVDVLELSGVTVRRELALDDAAERPEVVGQAADEGFVDRFGHLQLDLLTSNRGSLVEFVLRPISSGKVVVPIKNVNLRRWYGLDNFFCFSSAKLFPTLFLLTSCRKLIFEDTGEREREREKVCARVCVSK